MSWCNKSIWGRAMASLLRSADHAAAIERREIDRAVGRVWP